MSELMSELLKDTMLNVRFDEAKVESRAGCSASVLAVSNRITRARSFAGDDCGSGSGAFPFWLRGATRKMGRNVRIRGGYCLDDSMKPDAAPLIVCWQY